jgi:hypothetical protein
MPRRARRSAARISKSSSTACGMVEIREGGSESAEDRIHHTNISRRRRSWGAARCTQVVGCSRAHCSRPCDGVPWVCYLNGRCINRHVVDAFQGRCCSLFGMWTGDDAKISRSVTSFGLLGGSGRVASCRHARACTLYRHWQKIQFNSRPGRTSQCRHWCSEPTPTHYSEQSYLTCIYNAVLSLYYITTKGKPIFV